MKKFYALFLSLILTGALNAQVVISSSFESWTSGTPDGWSGSKTNLPVTDVVQVTGDSDYGNNSVRLVNTTTSHKRFSSQPLTVTQGQTFEIKFWVKGQGDVRTGIFDNANFSTTFGYHYNSYINVNATSYTMYTQTITADTNYNAAEFIFSLRNTVATNHIQIDSVIVSLMSVPSVSIYDIQYTTASPEDSPYAGQTVSTGGIVTAVYASGYFVQSGTGPWTGVHVFDGNNTPAIGDSVTFSASVSEYYNMTQLSSVSNYMVVSSGNTVPVATVISTADVNTEQYEGVLVQVVNATCVNDNAGFGMWTVNNGTADAKVHNLIYQATPVLGNVYSVTGPSYYAFSEFRIEPRDAADVVVTGFAGMNEWTTPELAAYPNPATDVITISNTGIAKVEIMDATGRIVLSASSNGSLNADLNSFDTGIYFIRVISENSVKTIRFQKQ